MVHDLSDSKPTVFYWLKMACALVGALGVVVAFYGFERVTGGSVDIAAEFAEVPLAIAISPEELAYVRQKEYVLPVRTGSESSARRPGDWLLSTPSAVPERSGPGDIQGVSPAVEASPLRTTASQDASSESQFDSRSIPSSDFAPKSSPAGSAFSVNSELPDPVRTGGDSAIELTGFEERLPTGISAIPTDDEKMFGDAGARAERMGNAGSAVERRGAESPQGEVKGTERPWIASPRKQTADVDASGPPGGDNQSFGEGSSNRGDEGSKAFEPRFPAHGSVLPESTVAPQRASKVDTARGTPSDFSASFPPGGMEGAVADRGLPDTKQSAGDGAFSPSASQLPNSEGALTGQQPPRVSIPLPIEIVDEPSRADQSSAAQSPEGQVVTYSVEKPESLWAIAEKQYGSGRYFRALFEHNATALSGMEVIPVGTQLLCPDVSELTRRYAELIPDDLRARNDRDSFRKPPADTQPGGESPVYTSREGDTLFSIAREQLGQASRYVEIWRLNRERLPVDTNHLRPLPIGLRLFLPVDRQPTSN